MCLSYTSIALGWLTSTCCFAFLSHLFTFVSGSSPAKVLGVCSILLSFHLPMVMLSLLVETLWVCVDISVLHNFFKKVVVKEVWGDIQRLSVFLVKIYVVTPLERWFIFSMAAVSTWCQCPVHWTREGMKLSGIQILAASLWGQWSRYNCWCRHFREVW